MKKLPYFSVIIPNHNRPFLVMRAIESIKAQKFNEVEIIVVSDIANLEVYKVCDQLLDDNDIYIRRNGIPCLSETEIWV